MKSFKLKLILILVIITAVIAVISGGVVFISYMNYIDDWSTPVNVDS